MSDSRPLRILLSAPAYWPALAFGGPIWEARELAAGLVARGHAVDVVTTTLNDIASGRSTRSYVGDVDGARIHYLATPIRYRWMGATPSAPFVLRRLPRPEVAHVLGFRDPLGITVAAWCRRRRIPYVLQPLGMLLPQLRKLRLKRVTDAGLGWVSHGAAAIVVTSEQERSQVVELGIRAERVIVRPIGFPEPLDPRPGALRRRLGLNGEPLVLYVGRLSAGKGIEFLLEAVKELAGVHLALVGPDAGHGIDHAVEQAKRAPATAGRIHRLETKERPLDLYGDADVFVLPSAGESFGLVAAEAAAAGAPIVVTDRCGVADAFRAGGALVVPYDRAAILSAIERVLSDAALRERLSVEARTVAAENSWEAAVERQEWIYRDVLARAR